MLSQHYCQEHQTKFFKNEKVDANGETKVWYSHKKNDGSGFCVEKNREIDSSAAPVAKTEDRTRIVNSIYACNAMNNAVALASNGKIPVEQIGDYYNKILDELEKTKH